MNEPLRSEIEEAFAAALEMSEPEQEAFLAREYARQPELRAEVESLLRAYRSAGAFLEPIAPHGVLTSSAKILPPLPATIGRYRILRLLGEGGMGAVYEAEQEQPRRTVALKVIKPGLASAELVRRFEQESQVLGSLQHPGIAQVYEAGCADSGFGPQPYFAMELISGESLLAYAEAHQLKVRQRLELMTKVGEAVHHAHQRGIIHRDLKPGNILVDESGQPKILDFGVARVTNSDAHATRQTDLGQLVGTVAYMSPEQVLADPLELDTRSDVYALGVILFELLAGRLPYKISRELHEAARTIREEDPAALGSISRTYRGDIETIVGKAIEKEKVRRYSSAAELVSDIQRYLRDEPIGARRPSAIYQLQKFARRHRTLVVGAASVFAVLIAGIVTSTWEAALARRAEQTATAERNRAVVEKERADKESAAAKAVNDFLQNDLLAQASASAQARPNTMPDPDLKVRTALDRAAERITGKFDKQPLIEASIRQTIGRTYKDLGLYPDARRQMERALELQRPVLGEEHPSSLDTINAIAELCLDQGKYEEAEPLFINTLEIRRRVLGEEHPDTLSTMNGLAALYFNRGKSAQAEALYVKVLSVQQRVLGERHPQSLLTMNNLARLYLDQGKYAQTEPLFARVLENRRRVLGEEHPDTLLSKDNLARLYLNQGKYALAEPLFVTILTVRRRVLGEEHPDTFISMNNLAVLYRKEGKLVQAESLLSNGLELQRRRLGEENPDTLLMMNNLARVYLDQGRYPQAETLFTRVLKVQRRTLGETHPDTLIMMRNLARLYHYEGRSLRAETLLTKVLQLQRGLLGADHPDTLTSMTNLARVYLDQNKYEEAEPLYARALEVRRRVLGPEHRDTTSVLASLGEIRLRQQKYADAELFLRDALKSENKNSPDAWERYNTQSLLGVSLAAQERFAEAEPLLLSGYEGLIQRKSAIPWEMRPIVAQAGERIVLCYQRWDQPEKAAEWREKLGATSSANHLP
jgi:tetratricopeptide (TPR) repeat protein